MNALSNCGGLKGGSTGEPSMYTYNGRKVLHLPARMIRRIQNLVFSADKLQILIDYNGW
jgi:hypothetical protein